MSMQLLVRGEKKLERVEIESKSRRRGWKLVPTLLKRRSAFILLCYGIIICMVPLYVSYIGFMNEMSGVFAVRPLEVYLLILTISFLIVFAILLYPFLAIHYRHNIVVKEEIKRLNKSYLEGLHVFNDRLIGLSEEQDVQPDLGQRLQITTEMSGKFPDFTYLHTVFLEYFNITALRSKSVSSEIEWKLDHGSTYEAVKKEKIRELINVTAEEILEDSTYNIDSYEMPVVYCMIAVAFGFIVLSLIPFLGYSEIQFGDVSLNLIWAAGGFVGAYIYSLYPLFQRYTRRDLPPRAFLDYAIRVLLGPIVMFVLGNFVLGITEEGYQFSWAIIGGSVPFLVLNIAREKMLSRFRTRTQSFGKHDVTDVSGITYDYGERLHEEGIMNLQNLAFVNTELLSKRTMFNKRMLFDWKDEAILRLLAGNVPHKNFSSASKSSETLYDKLREIGVNNITALANYLEAEKEDDWSPTVVCKPDSTAAKNLVKALGWTEEKEEYRFLLCKICVHGKRILGEIEAETTAYALSA